MERVITRISPKAKRAPRAGWSAHLITTYDGDYCTIMQYKASSCNYTVGLINKLPLQPNRQQQRRRQNPAARKRDAGRRREFHAAHEQDPESLRRDAEREAARRPSTVDDN